MLRLFVTHYLLAGIRLTFDQPIAIRGFYAVEPVVMPAYGIYGFVSGASSGMEAWKDGNTTAPQGWFQVCGLQSWYRTVLSFVRELVGASTFQPTHTPPAGATSRSCIMQPVAITGILADGVTLQLNVTWVPPTVPPTRFPGVLKYAMHDYPPAMPLIGVAGSLPASPFIINVTVAAP